MKKYPKLNFNIDKTFDYWTGSEFLTLEENDSFSERITETHPTLKNVKSLNSDDRKSYIEKVVDLYYQKNLENIEDSKKIAQSKWDEISEKFYKTTDKYFKKRESLNESYNWPRGEYNAFMSIFNCNPRFVEEKEFQLFYKNEEFYNQVCVHEMLHFIFYDYFEHEFPEMYISNSKEEIWKFSEVLNDVLLRQADYISITKVEDPGIYAQSDEELESNLDLWKESSSVEKFILDYFEKL